MLFRSSRTSPLVPCIFYFFVPRTFPLVPSFAARPSNLVLPKRPNHAKVLLKGGSFRPCGKNVINVSMIGAPPLGRVTRLGSRWRVYLATFRNNPWRKYSIWQYDKFILLRVKKPPICVFPPRGKEIQQWGK